MFGYVTDELREDGAQIEALMAARAAESTRAIQETYESRFLKACNAAQTNANANVVNGFAHRIASSVTNNLFTMDHMIAMKLAFDKANVPASGRILLVDPIVEATLNKMTNVVTTDIGPYAAALMENGWAKDHKFVKNLFGFDIITSNRLPKGSLSDGTTTVTDGVANIFMCVADDNTKPIMSAWRRMPKAEGARNKDYRRDEFNVTARFGFGAQRVDTLGVLITSASKY